MFQGSAATNLPACFALEEVSRDAEKAMAVVEKQLPKDFPEDLYMSVRKGLLNRLTRI